MNDIDALARRVHAVGASPDRIAVNPEHGHLAPEIILELASPADAYNFTRGQEFAITRAGFRPVRGWFGVWFGVWFRIRWRMHRLTRWWRPRNVCTAVNPDAGVITMELERWSWLRWRWER